MQSKQCKNTEIAAMNVTVASDNEEDHQTCL